MPRGVALKMLLENSSQRAFHPAYNARSTIARTPPAQPGSCNGQHQPRSKAVG
jgi:hypothetical protein